VTAEQGESSIVSDSGALPVTRVMLRPIATPLSLGFLALAIGSFVLSGRQLHWVSPDQARAVDLMLAVVVAPLQGTSAIFGFLARDAVAATGMGLLSGTWLATGLVPLLTGQATKASAALGLLLIASGVAMLVPAAVAAYSKLLATAVMSVAGVHFAVTGAFELSGVRGWQTASGAVGLALAALGLYAGLAFEVEDALRRTVLPTFRRRAGKDAIAGSLADEVAVVHHEAGVRQQL
jgi:succinate-acetate transporter protein